MSFWVSAFHSRWYLRRRPRGCLKPMASCHLAEPHATWRLGLHVLRHVGSPCIHSVFLNRNCPVVIRCIHTRVYECCMFGVFRWLGSFYVFGVIALWVVVVLECDHQSPQNLRQPMFCFHLQFWARIKSLICARRAHNTKNCAALHEIVSIHPHPPKIRVDEG